MVVDPATAMVIATGISSAAKGGLDALSNKKAKKQSKRKSKEAKRETISSLLQDALQRSAELEAHRLDSGKKISKRKSQSMQDTADLLRGALSI